MDHRLIHQLSDEQVMQLHALYQSEWWTRGRELDDIRRMLAHSDYVFGVEDDRTSELLAFARVLTDRTYKALIFDVIVERSCRERGLGGFLMEAILGHPDLAQVRNSSCTACRSWHASTSAGASRRRLRA